MAFLGFWEEGKEMKTDRRDSNRIGSEKTYGLYMTFEFCIRWYWVLVWRIKRVELAFRMYMLWDEGIL